MKAKKQDGSIDGKNQNQSKTKTLERDSLLTKRVVGGTYNITMHANTNDNLFFPFFPFFPILPNSFLLFTFCFFIFTYLFLHFSSYHFISIFYFFFSGKSTTRRNIETDMEAMILLNYFPKKNILLKSVLSDKNDLKSKSNDKNSSHDSSDINEINKNNLIKNDLNTAIVPIVPSDNNVKDIPGKIIENSTPSVIISAINKIGGETQENPIPQNTTQSSKNQTANKLNQLNQNQFIRISDNNREKKPKDLYDEIIDGVITIAESRKKNKNSVLLAITGKDIGRNGFDFLAPSKSPIPTPQVRTGGTVGLLDFIKISFVDINFNFYFILNFL